MKLYTTIFLFIISLSAFADTFCGVVLAENGLNVRTKPNLTASVIYKLGKGDTFEFNTSGYTEIYQTIKDGNEVLKGEWIEINIYENFKVNTGYIFMTPKYATEIYDCREFRVKVLKEELYATDYFEDKKKIDSLKSIAKLEEYRGKINRNFSKKEVYKKDKADFRILKDSLFLKLDTGKEKKIVSYPLGMHGAEENMENYTYIGYSARLHSYLVRVNYWESANYFFIHKKTGETSIHFQNLPIISPKDNYLVTIDDDPYEEEEMTDVTIFKIDNEKIKLLIHYHFSKWLYDNEALWISENEFLIAARSIQDKNNWIDTSYDNDAEAKELWKKVRKQFIRFKLLK